MNSASLAHYEKLLRTRATELTDQSSQSQTGRAPVALDQQSVGRVSRVDAMQQQAMAEAQERQRKNELVRIDRALKRIDEGEFGWCADCGELIAEARLNVDPSALLCVTCARNS